MATQMGTTGEGQLKSVLYTAEAVVEGSREGHGRTSDGRLDVDLSVSAAMSGDDGPGTNPEQLFAVGYAACFQSTVLGIARSRKLDATGSQITSRVGIGPLDSGGIGLQVSLDLHAPSIAAEGARELMLRADLRCPYSNPTRENIAVVQSVDGQPVARAG
jgi:Ohr subfamily peroxiredoxin